MSDLPVGWEIKTVGQLFDIQLGKMLNKKAKNTFPQYPYLGNSNVRWGSFELSELKTMHFSEKEMAKFALQRGDILLCEGGEVGRCAIWQEENPNIFYQKALHRLRRKNDVIPEYFQLYMQFINGSKLLDDFTSKTSIAHLTREKLTELPVKTPPLPEQRKIAQILSTWDKAIATTEKQIANSKQQKKALMQQLLTGKKRLAGFSGNWEVVKVSDFGVVVTGSTPPKGDKNNYGGSINWATAEDFMGKYIYDTNIKLTKIGATKARIVPKNSVLVTCIASIGKNAIAKAALATNQQINSVTVNSSNCNEFFYYQIEFNTHKLLAWAGTTAVPILNKSSFEKIKLQTPTLKEQQKIAQVLTTADNDISTLETQLTHLQQEKKALMQQLLTGKRRVLVD